MTGVGGALSRRGGRVMRGAGDATRTGTPTMRGRPPRPRGSQGEAGIVNPALIVIAGPPRGSWGRSAHGVCV